MQRYSSLQASALVWISKHFIPASMRTKSLFVPFCPVPPQRHLTRLGKARLERKNKLGTSSCEAFLEELLGLVGPFPERFCVAG